MPKLQQSVLHDTLELCDAQGKVIESIEYSINIPNTYTDVQKIRMELITLSKAKDKDNEAIGEQYIKLLRLFFGDENTDKILSFYGGVKDYNALVLDVGMMMIEHILPAYNDYGKKIVALRKALKK